jgi:ATP-dependent RNA helicase DDX23/PRP28
LQLKFLSKEERAKIAIEKRAQEIKEQKSKEEQQRSERENLERQAEEVRRRDVRGDYGQGQRFDGQRHGGGGGGRCEYFHLYYFPLGSNPRILFRLLMRRLFCSVHVDDDRHHGRRDRRYEERPPAPPPSRPAYQNGIPTGPRADRNRGPASQGSQHQSLPYSDPAPSESNTSSTAADSPFSATNSAAQASFVPPVSDADLSAIRSRYLGVDKKKRKIRKMNDRKFVFDWDEQEDTFATSSPLGGGVKGAAVMFGRGHLAGMDDTNVPVSGQRHADALERRQAGRSGIDERHWSEKPLEEMKERDWRIFREDFSISARGLCSPFEPSPCIQRFDLVYLTQVVKFRFRYGHGRSRLFLNLSSTLWQTSAMKNLLLSSARLFLLVCNIETSSVLQRLVCHFDCHCVSNPS